MSNRVIHWLKEPLLWACLFSCWIALWPLTDTDIWWHMASARHSWELSSFLRTDPFCFSPSRLPYWTNGHWLWQFLCWGIYSLGGVTALIAAKSLCWGVLLALWTWFWGGQRSPWLWVLPVGTWAGRYLILERPVLVSLLIWGLIACLGRRAQTGTLSWNRAWLGSFVLICLWSQCQGLFPLGLMWLGVWAGATYKMQGLKRACVGWLLCCVAPLINPYGWDIAVYALRLFRRLWSWGDNSFARQVIENRPLWQGDWLSVSLGVVLVLGTVFLWRRLDLVVRIWAILLLFLAWQAERNLILALVVLGPALVSHAPQMSGVIARYIWVLPLALVLSHTRDTWPWPQLGISPNRVPVQTVQWIKEHPDPRRMYNVDRHGGYLYWSLPGATVFTDGRFMLKSVEFFDAYQKSWFDPVQFEILQQQYHFGQVLLPGSAWGQFQNLRDYLDQHPRWYRVYSDPENILWRLR